MVAISGDFMEFIALESGEPELVTKSELIAKVRAAGYSVSDRQLTFYVTEGILPRSIRVGSRAGAYPSVVVELLTWILRARDSGVPIETLKELLPVWKFLVRSRKAEELNLAELEYVARQHVTSIEGALTVPRVVMDVLLHLCEQCRGQVQIVGKDGQQVPMTGSNVTVGFAIARMPDDDVDAPSKPQWFASTHISLAGTYDYAADPRTVILGLKPNAELPPPPVATYKHQEDEPDMRREEPSR